MHVGSEERQSSEEGMNVLNPYKTIQVKNQALDPESRGSFVKLFLQTLWFLDERESMQSISEINQRRGPIFLTVWEDLTISKVEIRGVAIGCHSIGSSGYQLTIDDGTGRISAVVWTVDQEANFPSIYDLHNHFVSIKGQLTGFRKEVQIKVEEIRVVALEEQPTEEALWWLDVKDEWEALAAARGNNSMTCPCLCHSGSKVACRSLGNPSVWSRSFNRAVAVISTALRAVEPVEVTVSDLTQLVKETLSLSASIQASPCFSDCATVEAIRQLLGEGYATRSNASSGLIRISSVLPIEAEHRHSNQEFSRFPLTQVFDTQD